MVLRYLILYSVHLEIDLKAFRISDGLRGSFNKDFSKLIKRDLNGLQ